MARTMVQYFSCSSYSLLVMVSNIILNLSVKYGDQFKIKFYTITKIWINRYYTIPDCEWRLRYGHIITKWWLLNIWGSFDQLRPKLHQLDTFLTYFTRFQRWKNFRLPLVTYSYCPLLEMQLHLKILSNLAFLIERILQVSKN